MSKSFTFWSSPLDQPSCHYTALSWCATYIILTNDETGTIIFICYLWIQAASSNELENVTGEVFFLPPVLHGFMSICLASVWQFLSWVDPSPRPWSNQLSAAGEACGSNYSCSAAAVPWDEALLPHEKCRARHWQQMPWWTCAFFSRACQILWSSHGRKSCLALWSWVRGSNSKSVSNSACLWLEIITLSQSAWSSFVSLFLDVSQNTYSAAEWGFLP